MLEHGTNQVMVEGEMVIGEVSGSHNEYDAKLTVGRLRQAIKSFDGLPFVELIDARRLQGVTPEGFLVIEKYNHWLLTQPLVARAFVSSSSVLPLIVRNNMETLSCMNMKNFADIDEAKQWLISELNSYHQKAD